MEKNGEEVPGKMFVGGLSWETTKEGMRQYFCRFGEVVDCTVMTNDQGRSRGFGFVTFKDPAVVDVIVQGGPHRIDGRCVDPKPCNPRGGPGKGGGRVGGARGRGYPKVFVGGLPITLTENELKDFFNDKYGQVFEVVIMYDQERRRSRGFGFVSFESEEPVDKAVQDHFVSLGGKQIEIKRAEPRDSLGGRGGGPMGGGGPRGGGDYGYGYGGGRNFQGGPGGPPYGGGQWGAPPQQHGPPGGYGYGAPYGGGYGNGGAPPPQGNWGAAPPPQQSAYPGYGGAPPQQAPVAATPQPAYGAPAPTYGTGYATATYGAPAATPAANGYAAAPPATGAAPTYAAQPTYGGGYAQEQSNYGPARATGTTGYEAYSGYNAPAAPGTEGTRAAANGGGYHPYRR